MINEILYHIEYIHVYSNFLECYAYFFKICLCFALVIIFLGQNILLSQFIINIIVICILRLQVLAIILTSSSIIFCRWYNKLTMLHTRRLLCQFGCFFYFKNKTENKTIKNINYTIYLYLLSKTL